MRHLSIILLVASLSCSAVEGLAPHVEAGDVPFLFVNSELTVFYDRVAALKAKPLYARVSAARQIAGFIIVESKTKTEGYTWQQGTHDLNLKPGRAAYAIEQITGLKISQITAKTSRDELAHIQSEANEKLDAFIVGVQCVRQEQNLNIPIKQLAEKYKGKFSTGIEGAPVLSKVLLEWFPIGQKLSDLETILGRETEKFDGRIYYGFGVDRDSVVFFFKVKDGIIECITWRPGYTH